MHLVTVNREEQLGHIAPLWKVSNGCWQWEHFQKFPMGGDDLQRGQAKPSRRGNFAIFDKARACFSPPQQFKSMKTPSIANQEYRSQIAITKNPAIPKNPSTVATDAKPT